MDYICTFVGVYTDVFILYFFLKQYSIKESWKGKICLFSGFGLINILMNMFEVIFFLKVAVSIAICVVIISLLYENVAWYEALKYMFVFYVLLGIGELLIIPIMIFVEGVYDIELFYSDSITSTWLITLIISRIMTLAFIKIVGAFFHKSGKKMKLAETALINVPLLLAFIVAVIVEHYLINIERFNVEDITSLLIILAVLLIAFILTYIKFMESNILAHKQESQILALEHRNEMQYIFYEEKRKYEHEIQRIRHDLKNHLLLLKEDNSIRNTTYYNEMLEIIESDSTILSGCNVFDVLINEKKKHAESLGIEFRILVVKNISRINYIKERDLCSIFGNVLDNAIESAGKVTDAYIEIKVDIINSFFYMNIKNSFDPKSINESAGKFHTTKHDSTIHGIGLQSVSISLEKYDGHMVIKHEEDVFSLEIMIPLD